MQQLRLAKLIAKLSSLVLAYRSGVRLCIIWRRRSGITDGGKNCEREWLSCLKFCNIAVAEDRRSGLAQNEARPPQSATSRHYAEPIRQRRHELGRLAERPPLLQWRPTADGPLTSRRNLCRKSNRPAACSRPPAITRSLVEGTRRPAASRASRRAPARAPRSCATRRRRLRRPPRDDFRDDGDRGAFSVPG